MIRIAISAVHRLMMLGNHAENRVTALARAGGYDGVICGHFHKPALRSSGGVTYANCGDGVDSLRANAPMGVEDPLVTAVSNARPKSLSISSVMNPGL